MLGETIKEFKITSVLGRGGMGEVYVATQQLVQTKVAIKLLLDRISNDRQHVQRFFNEAITASKIKHAGIVKIFDVGFHGERAFLIMEFLDGESLSARTRRPPRLELAEILDIGAQLASIMEATHAEGITHRDLKPDNIFLVPDAELASKRRVKVLDFGIAKLGHAPTADTASAGGDLGVTALTLTNSSMGTPGYMAPEQWVDASSADGRADVYSLGCVLFELCTGRPPFIATSLPEACAKHMNEVPPRVKTLAPEIPDALDALIATMLAKKPEARPSMAEVGAVFATKPASATSVATQETVAPTVVPTAPPTKPERARPEAVPTKPASALTFALGGMAVIGGALALMIALRKDNTLPTPPPAPPASPPVVTSPPVDTAPPPAPIMRGCPDGMVRVPAAELFMGTDKGMDWEQPVHRVVISKAYCIDRTEVTVEAYAACAAKGACRPAPTTVIDETMAPADQQVFSQFCNGSREDRASHPVNCVAWADATAYCTFVGKRLPTEAEWELAARGGDGRLYPWGNEPPTAKRLNVCGAECREYAKRVLGFNWWVAHEENDGWGATAPAGSFPAGASPSGALDMAGNVAEWTADWYAPYTADPVTDPKGPSSGTSRAARNAAWRDPQIDRARATHRFSPKPTRQDDQVGFRCARDVTSS